MKVTHATTQENLYFHDKEGRLTGSCLISITGNEGRVSGLHGSNIYLALIEELANVFTRHSLKSIRFVVEEWHKKRLIHLQIEGYKIEIENEGFKYDTTLLFWVSITKK
jgi:hypothetical protein